MYKIFNIILVALLISCISCHKESSVSRPVAFNIINAAVDVPSIYTYFTLSDSAFYLQHSPISYGASYEYGIPSGATPLSIVSSTDTTKPLFQSTLYLRPSGIYSLFLTGHYPSVDTMLIEDNIPIYSDSVAGVRVINLAQSDGPITVNLAGNDASHAEFIGLAYKQISVFKTYPDTNAIGVYNFEVRDQKTGDLLTTYSWSFLPFKSYTLVVNGSTDPNSSTPIGVFQMNNF
jgi:hypothetical protein